MNSGAYAIEHTGGSVPSFWGTGVMSAKMVGISVMIFGACLSFVMSLAQN